MENTIYRTFDLEEVLESYINKNGVSILLEKQINGAKQVANDLQLIPSLDEKIDFQLERDYLEDIGELKNESKEEQIRRIKRYQKVVNMLKERYGYKCQLCGYSFHMDNGKYYCEAHHIKMLSKDGSQLPENTIILCANHHRMFHYASNICFIGELIDNIRIIRIGEEEFTVQY